jgi:hypothetical protein
MTVQNRTTLKSYFITGASPSESDFSDLIDSTLLVEDIVDSLTSTSTSDPLSAAMGKILGDSIDGLDLRITSLENTEATFASNYYNKTEVDNKITAVDNVINDLPYGADISTLSGQITDLNESLSSKADISHTQEISSVVNLQTELDTRATVAQLNDVRDSLIASINAIDGVDGSVDLTGINSSIANLNSEVDALETKVNSHPLYTNLSDLPSATDNHGMFAHVHAEGSAYFAHAGAWVKLASIDTVNSLIADIELEDHKHVTADITDFNAEVQSKTNLLVSDHSSATNNPHNVTKAQVGLDKVENLTPSEIISQAGGVSQLDIDTVTNSLSTHIADSNNPHGVTKSDVGLSNVPNVDVSVLLFDHLTDSNPHNIDLSFFDVYATAEADARTQFYIDSLRYAFTPLANNDSAGAVGDFAYDQSNLYFKVSNSEWGKIPLNPVYIQRPANQEDVDAGLANSVGDLITVNEVELQEVTQINITENFNITNNEGDQVFNITEEGDVHLTSTSIENITIEGDTIINENISSSTEQIIIQDSTTIQGDTIIQNNDFSVTNVTNEEVFKVTNAGDVTIGGSISSTTENITIENNTTIDGTTTITGNTTISGDTTISGTATIDTITSSSETEKIVLSGESEVTGDFTVTGSTHIGGDITTESSTLNIGSPTTIEGNLVAPSSDLELLNTREVTFREPGFFNDPQTVSKSTGLSINHFNGDIASRIIISDPQNGFFEVAYKSDLPDLSDYALKSDLPTSGNDSTEQNNTGGTETDIIIPGVTGGELSGYAYSPSGKYAIDYGGDETYGTGDDVDEEYWSLTTASAVNTGLIIDFGDPATNPYIRYNIFSSKWDVFDGQDITVIGETPVVAELLFEKEGSDPYIRFDEVSGQWTAFNGTQLVNIGQSTTTNTTINETTVLQQTIIQQGLTIDAQSGGEENGYAFTEGSGKYSIDYGADDTFGTADDDDSEDYFEVDAESYQSSGLTVNVGLNPNPSILYDPTENKWEVKEGGSNGTFHLGDSYTKTESDDRYYSKTQSDGNYYTKTESDGRYKAINNVPVELFVDLPGTTADPYIRFDSVAGEWQVFNGSTLETIGASTTIINEGDNITNTTVLEQTIVQQSLTVDGTTGGEKNGYAYSEYDDGTGTLVGQKYSIDYGADNTFGTADDDDSEDYFEIEESAYNNAGLTVDAGLDPNPSIKYVLDENRWQVNDGGANGTFYLGEAEGYVAYDGAQTLTDAEKLQARTNIGAQVEGNYLTSVPSEYLTEAEGDVRYYTQAEVDAIAATFPTRQEMLEMIVAANNGTLLAPEYSAGAGGNYSIDYGADGIYGTADDGDNTADQDYAYEPSLAEAA